MKDFPPAPGSLAVPPPPVFNLPEDLMYVIFLDTCGSNHRRALELCLVCKRWRDFVLDTPILWSNIAFNSPPPYHLQACQLQRSKSAPLKVIIQQCEQHGMGMRSIASIIRLLRPHVHRFEFLDIRKMKAKGMRTFFDEIGSIKAPMLKSLMVRQSVDAKKWTLKPFGGHAQKLLSLTVACGKTDWHPSLLCNLTDLTLVVSSLNGTWHISVFDILTTLAQTPLLKNFNLQFERGHLNTGRAWSSKQVILEHLSSINFSTVTRTTIAMEPWMRSLLCGIVAPNLPRFPCTILPSCLVALNTCITLPISGLQDLRMIPDRLNSINELIISLNSFPALVKNLHQLRKLQIRGDQLIEAGFRCLSIELPCLNSLMIQGNPTSLQGLADMVLARIISPGLSTLTTLLIRRTFDQLDWSTHIEMKWFPTHVKDFQYLPPSGRGTPTLPIASRAFM